MNSPQGVVKMILQSRMTIPSCQEIPHISWKRGCNIFSGYPTETSESLQYEWINLRTGYIDMNTTYRILAVSKGVEV
jgi:hypothetical protein